MNDVARKPFSRLAQAAMAGLLVLGLSACAENFDSKVTRFSTQLPAPQGQSFAIVSDNPALAGGIEFSQYASLVAQNLSKYGYTPAPNPEAASLIVHFNYGIDKGRQVLRSTGFADPYWGPWRGYRGRFGYGGWGGGYGGFGRGAWGWGWNDPFFDNGIDVSTVYTSDITLRIDDKATSRRLFEGRAQAASTSDHLSYLVPNLVEAMFTGFPGNSGESLRITIAPEKKVTVKPDK
ncbi:DUF4136 domain-containing protein [Novosphingobium sp.]|jgi:hypothetical protein|uniref:DUF4136 domain-containing protein n=1 Tax=Novosphingobium sp. TaxID=1874826 RepID=UPI0031D4E4F5